MANGFRQPGSVLVVIPTLGTRPDLLRQALGSVISQESVKLAAVVVGPPSADEAQRLCDELGVPYVAQSSRGIGAAINIGYEHRGHEADLWAWLGDDDVLATGSAAWAVRVLEETPSAVMVYGDCLYIDAESRPLFLARPTAWAATLLRWGPNLVPQPGSFARATAMADAGKVDESLRYAMDLDLFLRLQRIGRIVYTPRTMASFRWHAGSLTASSTSDSEREAQFVRRRSWSGWERFAGRLIEVPGGLGGQLLYRAHRHRV